MLRTAIMASVFVIVMFSISFFMVLSANSIVDRIMDGVMSNDDLAPMVLEKPLKPQYHKAISFYKK
jgi:hypothetical protein